MLYKKAIHFKNGDILTITEEEAAGIIRLLKEGKRWIEVQKEFIAADHIGRIGNHHATAYMKNIENKQDKTNLKIKADETPRLETPEEIIKAIKSYAQANA